MADEPETTPIQNKYAQQYADDLAANRKEQADVAEQISGLQKHLAQLRVDESWLSQALGSLPAAAAPSEPEADPAAAAVEAPSAAETETAAPAEGVADALQTVPPPRGDKPVKAAQSKQPAKKTAAKKTAAKKTTTTATAAKATAKKTAAKKTTKKTAVEKAPAETATTAEVPAQKTASKEKAGPPLHELILAILLKTPGEPRVAREVTDQLAQDHPSRKTTIQTVRNNLETLVKKNAVEKSHQQGSAMYTAFADAEAAPAADDAAGGEAEEAPETAAEKVPAEV